MLVFDRMDPSSTVGGASNEAGPSSSVHGEVAVSGLAGGVAEEIPENGAEPGEGGVKAGGSSLKPGLFGEGRRVVGERERLAYTHTHTHSQSDVRVQHSAAETMKMNSPGASR